METQETGSFDNEITLRVELAAVMPITKTPSRKPMSFSIPTEPSYTYYFNPCEDYKDFPLSSLRSTGHSSPLLRPRVHSLDASNILSVSFSGKFKRGESLAVKSRRKRAKKVRIVAIEPGTIASATSIGRDKRIHGVRRKEGRRAGRTKIPPAVREHGLKVAVNSGWRDIRISSYVWRPYFFHDDSTGRLTESRTLVPRQIIIVQCALHCARSGGSTPRRSHRVTWFSLANQPLDKGLRKLSDRRNSRVTLKKLDSCVSRGAPNVIPLAAVAARGQTSRDGRDGRAPRHRAL